MCNPSSWDEGIDLPGEIYDEELMNSYGEVWAESVLEDQAEGKKRALDATHKVNRAAFDNFCTRSEIPEMSREYIWNDVLFSVYSNAGFC